MIMGAPPPRARALARVALPPTSHNSSNGDQRKPNKSSPKAATPHEAVVCVPETGWNSSIWNPHVSDGIAAAAAAAAAGGVACGAASSGAGTGGGGAAGLSLEEGGAFRGGGGVKLVSPQEEVLRQQAVATVFSRFQARAIWDMTQQYTIRSNALPKHMPYG